VTIPETERETWTIKAKPLHPTLVRELADFARIRWQRPEIERYLLSRGSLEPGPGLGLVFHTAGEGYWLMPIGGEWQESGEIDDFDDDLCFRMEFCWIEEAGGGMLTDWADNPFGVQDRSGTWDEVDTIWREACAAVADEVGPPDDLLPERRIAVWRIGRTALMVGQGRDEFTSQGDIDLCMVQLRQYEDGFADLDELTEYFC
jgi:hypothetical protein